MTDATFGGSPGPGMFMVALDEIAPADIPATIADFAPSPDDCLDDDGLTDYDDGAFGGHYQLWADCGGVGAALVILIANAYSGQGSVVIGVQLLTEPDFDRTREFRTGRRIEGT